MSGCALRFRPAESPSTGSASPAPSVVRPLRNPRIREANRSTSKSDASPCNPTCRSAPGSSRCRTETMPTPSPLPSCPRPSVPGTGSFQLRPVARLQPSTGTADCPRQSGDRLVLADDAAVQLLLDPQQFGNLFFFDRRHGHAGPARHHFFDIVLRHAARR